MFAEKLVTKVPGKAAGQGAQHAARATLEGNMSVAFRELFGQQSPMLHYTVKTGGKQKTSFSGSFSGAFRALFKRIRPHSNV